MPVRHDAPRENPVSDTDCPVLSLRFWQAAFDRALRTYAQVVVALAGSDVTKLVDLDWGQIFTIAAYAAMLSVFTSLSTCGLAKGSGPGFVENLAPEKAARDICCAADSVPASSPVVSLDLGPNAEHESQSSGTTKKGSKS